jgi:Zn-finger nucleic acid-binding protein
LPPQNTETEYYESSNDPRLKHCWTRPGHRKPDSWYQPKPKITPLIMKCPACKNPLREKGANGMTLDICYGGCGGIWFDANELESVDARAATSLHTVWTAPHKKVALTEPRLCPRCPEQVLNRKWFSAAEKVEIDQCPKCGGIWLDAGEFSQIFAEMKVTKITPPGWATAMAEAAALVSAMTTKQQTRPS